MAARASSWPPNFKSCGEVSRKPVASIVEALFGNLAVLDRVQTNLIHGDALARSLGRYVKLEADRELVAVDIGALDRPSA